MGKKIALTSNPAGKIWVPQGFHSGVKITKERDFSYLVTTLKQPQVLYDSFLLHRGENWIYDFDVAASVSAGYLVKGKGFCPKDESGNIVTATCIIKIQGYYNYASRYFLAVATTEPKIRVYLISNLQGGNYNSLYSVSVEDEISLFGWYPIGREGRELLYVIGNTIRITNYARIRDELSSDFYGFTASPVENSGTNLVVSGAKGFTFPANEESITVKALFSRQRVGGGDFAWSYGSSTIDSSRVVAVDTSNNCFFCGRNNGTYDILDFPTTYALNVVAPLASPSFSFNKIKPCVYGDGTYTNNKWCVLQDSKLSLNVKFPASTSFPLYGSNLTLKQSRRDTGEINYDYGDSVISCERAQESLQRGFDEIQSVPWSAWSSGAANIGLSNGIGQNRLYFGMSRGIAVHFTQRKASVLRNYSYTPEYPIIDQKRLLRIYVSFYSTVSDVIANGTLQAAGEDFEFLLSSQKGASVNTYIN